MTIIAGFPFRDGIMMCADTEEVISSEGKAETEKLRLFPEARPFVLCGGAWDSNLVEFAMDVIEEDFSTNSYKD